MSGMLPVDCSHGPINPTLLGGRDIATFQSAPLLWGGRAFDFFTTGSAGLGLFYSIHEVAHSRIFVTRVGNKRYP